MKKGQEIRFTREYRTLTRFNLGGSRRYHLIYSECTTHGPDRAELTFPS